MSCWIVKIKFRPFKASNREINYIFTYALICIQTYFCSIFLKQLCRRYTRIMHNYVSYVMYASLYFAYSFLNVNWKFVLKMLFQQQKLLLTKNEKDCISNLFLSVFRDHKHMGDEIFEFWKFRSRVKLYIYKLHCMYIVISGMDLEALSLSPSILY